MKVSATQKKVSSSHPTGKGNRAKIHSSGSRPNPLKNPSFRYLIKSFTEWLDILGYAPKTLKTMEATIRELLHYLEQKEITHIKALSSELLKTYYNNYLTQRPNKSRSGGLSNVSLNGHITSIRKFLEYLRTVGRLTMPPVPIKLEKTAPRTVYLTVEEIQLLFEATTKQDQPVNTTPERFAALQSRDRAMLAVYYGCGLRRNEGIHLTINDINFDKALLHVRKGKKNTQRYVPISKTSLKHLQDYIYDHRPVLLRGSKAEALFIGAYQKPISSQTLIIRLKALQYRSEDLTLQEKEIGLHTLRHSIATHLLAAGMSLENISRFLGHSSLESTQVYTHLSSEACATAKANGDTQLGEEGISKTSNQPFNNIPNYEIQMLQDDDE